MFKYAATIVLALPGFIFLMRFCLGAIYYASSTWNDNCLKSIPYQLSIYSCKWVDISKGCCLGILSLCFSSRGLHLPSNVDAKSVMLGFLYVFYAGLARKAWLFIAVHWMSSPPSRFLKVNTSHTTKWSLRLLLVDPLIKFQCFDQSYSR